LKVLIEIGSDINYKNNQGLSLLHVAAQGDQAQCLVFLRSIGQNHEVVDKKLSLPLHWASYMGCETAASILLSWNSNTNIQDEDGHTPLHLATLAGNARIIRNLLLKGADRLIKVLAK
jgi:palmitoyltransferase